MGKKNKDGSNLGRSLIKDRFGAHKGKKLVENNSMLHTTEIQDGYDWGRLNLQSVTEESSFQEFLSTAELADTEFQGEKLNITFVNPRTTIGLLSSDERKKIKQEHEQHKDIVKIPRRPAWDKNTTASELDKMEREQFLEWRRKLAALQDEEGFLLTPYEKNLEFWRQLWRVVERSDIIVQIVDARNPLLFRCEDLEKYVKEVSENKMNMILINKADFLTEEQRKIWAEYFDKEGIQIAFFSALDNTSNVLENIKEDIEKLDEAVEASAQKLAEVQEQIAKAVKSMTEGQTSKSTEDESTKQDNTENNETVATSSSSSTGRVKNTSEVYTKERLIELFKSLHVGPKVTENVTTVGLVGYPNVGKSSTINTLLTYKKVSVSATPGKTKHFQTIYLDRELLLCDCPGLVMPSFVFTKAEMVVSGILPIHQMRDHVPPVTLVANLIPRHVLEDRYGIMLPLPEEGEDPNRPPTSEELLNAYGYNRGFMTANGQPDNPRSSRYILKDFVNGKLLYCHAPPNIPQASFHTYPPKMRASRPLPPREYRAIKGTNVSSTELDRVFFQENSKGYHAKGVMGKATGLPTSSSGNETGSIAGSMQSLNIDKPWKKINKHVNKKKKEKLRRVYAHLDEH